MTDETEHSDRPSRRGVLALLGAGAMVPAALALLRDGPPTARGSAVADSLRFEVLGATRRPLGRHDGVVEHPESASWPDVVRVDLRVLNLAASSLLVSPGQFRLRVGGLSVMPTAWAHGPAGLEPGGERTGWIDYRAPASSGLLSLDFTAAGRREPVTVPLTSLLAVRS